MKLPKLKLTLLLTASLLLSSCTETASGIKGLLAAILLFSGTAGVNFGVGLLPPDQSDTSSITVIVGESASNTALSSFEIRAGMPLTAMGGAALTGVKASGITAFYGGFFSVTPVLYLWHDGTIEILDHIGTSQGSINVVTGAQIGNFVVAPDGLLGYATVAGSSKFYIVDLMKKIVSKTVDFGTGASPVSSAVSSDGTKVYVEDAKGNYYTVDPSSGNFTTGAFTAGASASGIPTISPDGTQLWVPLQSAGALIAWDLTSGTPSSVLTLHSPASPTEIVFSLDGATAFVVNSPSSGNGTISSINAQSGKANWETPVGANPRGLTLSPAGTFLLVANTGSGNIEQISTANGSVLATTAVGKAPVGAVMTLDPQ